MKLKKNQKNSYLIMYFSWNMAENIFDFLRFYNLHKKHILYFRNQSSKSYLHCYRLHFNNLLNLPGKHFTFIAFAHNYT